MYLDIIRNLFAPPKENREPEMTSAGYVPWRKISHLKLPEYEYPGYGVPLDYTFRELKHLSELLTEEPNSGIVKRKTKSAIEEGKGTKSILKIDNGGGRERDVPSLGSMATPVRIVQINDQRMTFGQPAYNSAYVNTLTVKISNNYITSMAGLGAAMTAVLDDPSKLSWLDLSHNKITSIDPAILEYRALTVLYLHANEISSLDDVAKLAHLPRLQKLTLHGNPIERHSNYRAHIICLIPTLRTLDFIAITKLDRDGAATYRRAWENKIALRASFVNF